jgi:hypothetical protein
MAQVITRCPLTGHYMFMGIDVAPEQFASFPDSFTRKYCPFCCCEHEWRKAESKLVDRRPTKRRDLPKAL